MLVTPETGGPALVIGDSLAAAAEDELLDAARSHGIELLVRAEPGRSIAAAAPILRATTRFPQVVIALGTNDVGASATTLEGLITDVLAAAAGRHIWWVDVGLADASRAAHLNDTLERAACDNTTLDLVRWSRRMSADQDLLAPDGVHLTPAGRVTFAATIVNALQS